MGKSVKTLGIIFANMHDEGLAEITNHRTMGSIPFGGRYRLIDFPLSGFVNAGVVNIGVVTKTNYHSLMDHIGSGREWDLSRNRGGLHILPPFGDDRYGVYHGRIDALGSALRFLRSSSEKYVLMSDCNLIANIDYRAFINSHIESGADISVMYAKQYLTAEQAANISVFEFDDDNRLCGMLLKPQTGGDFSFNMDTMIMEKDFLINLISEALSKGHYLFDRDILQGRLNDYHIAGLEHTGYLSKISNIKEYYSSNLDLLTDAVRSKVFLKERPVYTRIHDEVPATYGLDSNVKNSLVADGCVIDGTVENSILSRDVTVKKGAVVRNCIIMQGTVVGEKCSVQYAITDKDVVVSDYRSLSGSSAYPVYVSKSSVV